MRPILFLLMLVPQLVFAWSDKGHKLVAELAWGQLPEPVQIEIQRILKQDNLLQAAVWADYVKGQSRYKHLKKLHYVNLPCDSDQYIAARDCKKNRCVVEAIKKYQIQLADQNLPMKDRRLALRMLVHLIGDIHQPMHAGYQFDRGGNKYKVHFLGDKTNLHQLWDSKLINALKLDAKTLQKSSLWQVETGSLSPAGWAQESHEMLKNIYPVARQKNLGRNYMLAHGELVKRQLILASKRLHKVLTVTFAYAMPQEVEGIKKQE